MAASPQASVTLCYSFSGSGNYSTLTNIQSISYSVGRTWATDPYAPGTCTIVMRGAATFGIGEQFLLTDKQETGVRLTGNVLFVGTVKDTRIDYGMVSNLDYTTITLETILARWGRRQFTSRAIAQATTLSQISTLATAIGYNSFTTTVGTGQSIASAQTYVGNGLDLINQIVQTEVGHIAETGFYTTPSNFEVSLTPMTYIYQRNYDTTANTVFADDSTAAGIRYSDIQFTSAAQNYYTEATINPLGLASQTSGSGYYNITQDSLDYSTGQALSHAQYLVSQYNSTSNTPVSITASYANQDTATRQSAFKTALRITSGELINIKFRSTTYACVVEGVQVAMDPSETRLELTLSAFDNNNYLILNNTTFGTLGTSSTYPGNKLGF